MKTSNKTPLLFILLSILFVFSCRKDNIKPSVKFIQPQNNLIITQDTSLTITVDANDIDGDIKKVELFINGILVKEFTSPPYQYEWMDAKLENEGTYIIKAIAYDNNDAINEAKISITIKDFRSKYLGNFYFQTITELWTLGQPTTYDTSFYSGVIRRYELADSDNDLYLNDDSGENPNAKITIEFKPNTKITSLLNEDGNLIPKTGYHYYHQGGFSTTDTIVFSVEGLGGLGGGWNYYVIGIRE